LGFWGFGRTSNKIDEVKHIIKLGTNKVVNNIIIVPRNHMTSQTKKPLTGFICYSLY
jgi:hypothetical protein